MASSILSLGRQLLLRPFAFPSEVICFAGNMIICREASKKAGGSSRNQKGRRRPKHRGIKYQDGSFVQKGTILLTQNKLRCHPGLNVGFGRNGTLFAMEAGKVVVTCERINPNLSHKWVEKTYGDLNQDSIYKKYFHVLPEPQHCRFKLIDEV